MKKKLRKIVIDNIDYFWKLAVDDEHRFLTVYKGKKLFMDNYRISFMDYGEPITPQIVLEIIKNK